MEAGETAVGVLTVLAVLAGLGTEAELEKALTGVRLAKSVATRPAMPTNARLVGVFMVVVFFAGFGRESATVLSRVASDTNAARSSLLDAAVMV